MLAALLVGTVLAFVLAIPPGPVGVTAMKLGLTKGIRQSMQFAVGTGLLDAIFCMAAIFSTSAASSLFSDFNVKHPLIYMFIQLSVIFAFLIFGVLNLKKQKQVDCESRDNAIKQHPVFTQLRNKGPFFLGLAIALANLANPTFMIALASMTGAVQKFDFFANTAINNLVFALGFGLGNFLWIYVLVNVVVRFQSRMPEDFIQKVRQFAGITFIGFGGYFGWRLLVFTKWPEIFRLAFAF